MQGLKNTLILETLIRDVVSEAGSVSEEDVRKYYKDHFDEFLVPEMVHLKQIVVKERSLASSLHKRLQKGEATWWRK